MIQPKAKGSVLCLCVALAAACSKPVMTQDITRVLDQISANSLRGHVAFLASDLLEGRCTPRRGGDLAAEYIAAQFRRAGVKPAGDDEFFQTANWRMYTQPANGFELTIHQGKRALSIGKDHVWLYAFAAQDLSAVPVVKLDLARDVRGDELRGKAVAVLYSADSEEHHKQYRRFSSLRNELVAAAPALVLAFAPSYEPAFSVRLDDPDDPPRLPPPINIQDPKAIELLSQSPFGPTGLTVSLRLSAPSVEPVKLRNVVGVLPGSDPVLKDTWVLVEAKYDKGGIESEGSTKAIYHGADGSASGVATMIELASVLTGLRERPKRSIAFIGFGGDEMYCLGSRYYLRHPVFPLEKTVAAVNLTMLGRPETSKGPQPNKMFFTGFDYSEVPAVFQSAGKQLGVEVYKHELYSDQLFDAACNVMQATMGVPAHSISVTTELTDMNEPSDTWQKLDYENMARIDRAIALGVLMIANNPVPPTWNEANPKAEPYLKAWKTRPPPPSLFDNWPWVPGVFCQ